MSSPLKQSEIPGIPVRRGKVRDVYDFGDHLLFVATDRISAFDWILPTAIPDKGRILTQISDFWFSMLGVENHFISLDLSSLSLPPDTDVDVLRGRSMIVRKTEVVPVECVVRGYLEGSGWKEYQRAQSVCGINLPPGLQQGSQLPEPIFTPATKAEEGHDENISFEQMCEIVGAPLANKLRSHSLEIYSKAASYADQRGIIIADTKFEFGQVVDQHSSGKETKEGGHSCLPLLLIDEVLTPDSSRFWPKNHYEPGHKQPSFDKQFVREWLESTDWDKNSPPPELPEEIVNKTRAKYIEAYEQLTGKTFA